MQSCCRSDSEGKSNMGITAEFRSSIKQPETCHTMYLFVQKPEQDKVVKNRGSGIKSRWFKFCF